MLRLDSIVFRFGGRLLLEGASAAIAEGHKVGLVGRNGSGKSTLLKLIIGDLAPESGRIEVPRRSRIGLVAQEAPATRSSLIETVLLADTERSRLLAEADGDPSPERVAEIHLRLADIDAHSAPARAAAILSGLGFSQNDQQRPTLDFSGGWRMRVALAAMLFANPDLLLLDEPTNYLDLEGVMWLEDYLRRYRGTVIIVSHDRDLLNTAVEEILHLEDRRLFAYSGNYDRFEDLRRLRLENIAAERTRQETARKHIQAYIDRFRYKATKARQAQSRIKALARMKPAVEIEREQHVTIAFPQPAELAPPLLAMDDVTAGYEGKTVLRRLSLRIDQDDRIALLGANGNGKSTFAKLLAGRIQPLSGTIHRQPRLKIGYFAQHQLDALKDGWTPVQHLNALLPELPTARLRARLGQFGFGAERADLAVGKLSGGEKARLVLALISVDSPHLLVLDEPTNHLDIDAREALIRALNDYSGAAILISHDRHLLETTADRLWLVADGTVTPFEGDLGDYRDLMLAPKAEEKSTLPRGEKRRAAARQRSDAGPLRRAAERAEAEVTRLSTERNRIETALSDPALHLEDPAQAARLAKAHAETLRALAAAEENWLAAAESYEKAMS